MWSLDADRSGDLCLRQAGTDPSLAKFESELANEDISTTGPSVDEALA
jgi:hypothetical protein